MEAQHPPRPPLTPAQQAAMEQFRARIHQLVLSGGLSGESLRRVVQAMREHPEFSREILQVVTQELREMQELAPWTHLFRLD